MLVFGEFLMLRLTQITRAIFCMVSMILTSLFALSLSGLTMDEISWQEGQVLTIPLAALFVLIGCCIDIGKYLFWALKQHGRHYGYLSLALMGFSWLASCAFFTTSENRMLQKAQVKTPEYAAFEQRVESITQQITHYEKLRDKRLSSSYHQQWAESQANMDKITALKVVLTSLIEKSSSVGDMAAHQEVATSQFFSEVSRMMNVDIGLVRGISYGLLSLLLEVSTLAMISLTTAFNHSNSSRPMSKPVDEPVSHMDVDQQRAVLQLTGDILNGRIPPVLRTIKTAHYGLDIDVIREVLRSLRFTGILTDDKRKSFKLNPLIQL